MVTRTGDIPIAMCTELRPLNWLLPKNTLSGLRKRKPLVNLNFKWCVPLRRLDRWPGHVATWFQQATPRPCTDYSRW